MLGYARILNQSRGDFYDNPLKAGEVVRLRSGGPMMVVEEVDGEGRIICVWNTGMSFQREGFRGELLRRASRRSFFGLRR
jgi:uncharacterized protein YodC (DUF2158 family)